MCKSLSFSTSNEKVWEWVNQFVNFKPFILNTVDNYNQSENRFDAALEQGKSFTYLNWKLTVVESGDFGDVVKVEKIQK